MSDVTATRFLDSFGEEGAELPSTDDLLGRVLPLFEQVAQAHDANRVAPLDSVEHVRSVAGRLFYASDATREPKHDARVADDVAPDGAVQVAGRFKRDESGHDASDLSIGDLEEPGDRPVFLPKFVAWEHVKGHHDALTDIFALGIIATSVALDADLGDVDQLRRFVAHRKSLVALNPRLHPVVARVLANMTELDRRTRSQDLRTIIAALRAYREQRVDQELGTADATTTRRVAIFRRLRDRLFDFSRRNRLLYFKPTAGTVDLTAASVPLVLDVRNIDANTLFTFRGRASEDVLSEKPIPLNRYVRFEDYPFVGPALDTLRIEAKRSRAELGFSQLRLVVCFLHWHDIKEAPEERINSPLLLLPVELDKKRGVRDAHTLTATDDRAEVNPVLRQYLRQRYAIELPEYVDLDKPGAIDELHAKLVEAIHASEPGITLEKLDKPRIDLVIAVARKKLDAYRRKVKLSGRNVRSRAGLDYAYLGEHVRPLGVQLFHAYVAPRDAPDSVMHDPPRPVIWKAQPAKDAKKDDAITKELYSLKNAADEGGPYRWAFDLTSVTLANFNYRNVSLVRDYATLMDEDDDANAAFAAVFRDDARPVEEAPPPLPLPERHEVVLADPTQSSAVARSRAGSSYVIQGPPGTGKSQTITNLIADHVARGKRVLFVCEKRAALDVVHHRLVQVGLGPLATLIHDAQEDKKPFLKDLKETYEGWLSDGATTKAREARDKVLADAAALLERAGRLQSAMLGAPAGADVSLLAILRRAVELRAVEATDPEGVTLPAHRAVIAALPAVERVESSLAALGHRGPLGSHAARLVGPTVFEPELLASLSTIAACEALAGTTAMGEVALRHRYARRAKPLVTVGLEKLLDASSDASKKYRAAVALVGDREAAFEVAARNARGWREPLATDDANRALVQVKKFESGFAARLFRWLSPSWWKLRGLLLARFDVATRVVLGDWSEILVALLAQHAAQTELDAARKAVADELRGLDLAEARRLLEEIDKTVGPAERAVRDRLLAGGSEARAIVDAASDTPRLEDQLAVVREWQHLDASTLRRELASLDREGITPLRGPLGELDRAAEVAAIVRRYPLTGRALEALVGRRAIATALRERAPDLAIAEGSIDAMGDELSKLAAELRDANAKALVEHVRSRFVEAALDTNRTYATGRKELEHELGKVMRHKTIREIVSGPAGAVVRDLKPIWLMSPLSVADVLPLEASFDLVIFDEASQIPLENAVPAIHRAGQVIVVGDRQQLPPTNFFAASLDDDEEEGGDEIAEALDRELDSDSLLTHADRTLPSTLLGWHYRSRHESLIDFSNRVFYAGRLLTVPPVREAQKRAAIVARTAEDGVAGGSQLLERPISFHKIEHGMYESRQNLPEARYIAQLVKELLAKDTKHTIGIVAFSEAQQGAIEAALTELCEVDPELRTRLDEEMAREEDGQHVGLFVKNLENVQGDERDVIIVSVCYGPDPRGRMIMNFGPINRKGGERRLNVIFSRAKHHVALVSTIDASRITNDYNDGAACLKAYLQYAAACSTGDVPSVRPTKPTEVDPVIAELATRLRARGWDVALSLGASRLRCDLAIRKPRETKYRLGILVDHPAHWALGADEAMRLKPGVLRAFGWSITTVLTKDWLRDPEGVVHAIEDRASRA